MTGENVGGFNVNKLIDDVCLPGVQLGPCSLPVEQLAHPFAHRGALSQRLPVRLGRPGIPVGVRTEGVHVRVGHPPTPGSGSITLPGSLEGEFSYIYIYISFGVLFSITKVLFYPEVRIFHVEFCFGPEGLCCTFWISFQLGRGGWGWVCNAYTFHCLWDQVFFYLMILFYLWGFDLHAGPCFSFRTLFYL